MRFESNSNGPGRIIDRRGQAKPKLDPKKANTYKVSAIAGRYDRGNASKLGLSGFSAQSLRSKDAHNWKVGLPSRPGPNRKRPR